MLRSDRALVAPSEHVAFWLTDTDEATADSILDSVRVLPDGWTTVPFAYAYAPLGGDPPRVPGLETELREVWSPDRAPGDWVGIRPAPGSVVETGSTLTVLVSAGEAPVGFVDPDQEITLWHCGIDPTRFAGLRWDTAWPPPFDATNAPSAYREPKNAETFTGHGTMELVAADEAVYTDDGGVVLAFRPAGTRGHGTPVGFGCD